MPTKYDQDTKAKAIWHPRGPFLNRERAFCLWFVHGFVNVALVQADLPESPSGPTP